MFQRAMSPVLLYRTGDLQRQDSCNPRRNTGHLPMDVGNRSEPELHASNPTGDAPAPTSPTSRPAPRSKPDKALLSPASSSPERALNQSWSGARIRPLPSRHSMFREFWQIRPCNSSIVADTHSGLTTIGKTRSKPKFNRRGLHLRTISNPASCKSCSRGIIPPSFLAKMALPVSVWSNCMI